MSDNDNIRIQDEEIEALSAIYGDDWVIVDSDSKKYGIKVADENSANMIFMEVSFPPDYPKTSPPQYILSAPWLRREERISLEDALADIYCANIGESVIFLWVEKIREFLQEKSEMKVETKPDVASPEKVEEKSEGEEDWSEDSFAKIQEELIKRSHSTEQEETKEEVTCPDIHHGESFMDRKSVFQGHIAAISHTKQVKLVLDSLCQSKKIAMATHNIYAYRIIQNDQSDVYYQGCEDDGETQAGSRMLHLMQIVDARNVIVVVTRWYGGVHLGPDRFKHINNCARQLLDDHGYIKSKNEKKGPKSSKKKR
ncbi:protein IMPACT-B-like isoform X2 [Ostrea edulis]|uniref:protein IMPACT-B-like isoform X2 n=1 Tax=Ostrea edulis TaxID=37623 RepID=UPI0024AFCA96|nr:protein IMPACT-B-like isoform X2 [Ostrea edulis]